jgi:hypothetical protein
MVCPIRVVEHDRCAYFEPPLRAFQPRLRPLVMGGFFVVTKKLHVFKNYSDRCGMLQFMSLK